MKAAWVRKESLAKATDPGPLRGTALARLKAMPTPTLMDWVDNSLSKIGKLVSDSARQGVDVTLIQQAETEAAALAQALRELVYRGVR